MSARIATIPGQRIGDVANGLDAVAVGCFEMLTALVEQAHEDATRGDPEAADWLAWLQAPFGRPKGNGASSPSWTVKHLAQVAGLTRPTIIHHIKVGNLRAYRAGSRRGAPWVIPETEARRWLDGRNGSNGR